MQPESDLCARCELLRGSFAYFGNINEFMRILLLFAFIMCRKIAYVFVVVGPCLGSSTSFFFVVFR